MDELSIDAGRVTEILCGFVAQEVRGAGFEHVVIGLSGGIDSATSAFLAARALGPEHVFAVLMPYRESRPESRTDALKVVEAIGIEHVEIEITPIVEPYFDLCPDMGRVRRGNVMARARMIILYDQSHARHALVLGTGNKTESLLGYTTLWGDMACAINPLGDLYKTQVRALAHHLGVPTVIIDKPPSADLWSGQTDEGELGFTYDDVDRLLFRMVDRGMSARDAEAAGSDPAFIARVTEMVKRSEYKRRLPVSAALPPTGAG